MLFEGFIDAATIESKREHDMSLGHRMLAGRIR
jgi:hypothetical protein